MRSNSRKKVVKDDADLVASYIDFPFVQVGPVPFKQRKSYKRTWAQGVTAELFPVTFASGHLKAAKIAYFDSV